MSPHIYELQKNNLFSCRRKDLGGPNQNVGSFVIVAFRIKSLGELQLTDTAFNGSNDFLESLKLDRHRSDSASAEVWFQHVFCLNVSLFYTERHRIAFLLIDTLCFYCTRGVQLLPTKLRAFKRFQKVVLRIAEHSVSVLDL